MEFQMRESATEPPRDFVYTMSVNRRGWRSDFPGRRRRSCAEPHGKHFLFVTLSSDGVPDARNAVRGLKDGSHRIPSESLYSKRQRGQQEVPADPVSSSCSSTFRTENGKTNVDPMIPEQTRKTQEITAGCFFFFPVIQTINTNNQLAC